MESNYRDELDGIIDRALSSYSGAEPLAGLEERVLNRIRVAGAPRRRSLRWALALPILTSLVFVAIALRTRHNPVPKTTDAARTRTASVPLPPARSLETSLDEPRVAPKRRGRIISTTQSTSPTSLPKEEQFPARAPITGEERVLLAFIERDPIEAQHAFAELQKRNNEQIDIQAIEIRPLQSDGAQ